MTKYEVITTQVDGSKGRVIHKEFYDAEEMAKYVEDICVYDDRTVHCSIYKNGLLMYDAL